MEVPYKRVGNFLGGTLCSSASGERFIRSPSSTKIDVALVLQAAKKGSEMSMTLEDFKKELSEIDKGLRPFPATAQVFFISPAVLLALANSGLYFTWSSGSTTNGLNVVSTLFNGHAIVLTTTTRLCAVWHSILWQFTSLHVHNPCSWGLIFIDS